MVCSYCLVNSPDAFNKARLNTFEKNLYETFLLYICTSILSRGVMVALQILVLPVQVRILAGQQRNEMILLLISFLTIGYFILHT
jgi:hypothetical protein